MIQLKCHQRLQKQTNKKRKENSLNWGNQNLQKYLLKQVQKKNSVVDRDIFLQQMIVQKQLEEQQTIKFGKLDRRNTYKFRYYIFFNIYQNIETMSEYSQISNKPKCFKIILVGNATVGKTSLLMRYTDNTFNQLTNATVGLDYRTKNITFNNQSYKLQLFDTVGQQRYRNVVINYFKLAKASCVVFDISKEKSINECRYWLNQLDSHCENILKVLVGNKSDLLETFGSNEEIDKYLSELQPQIKEIEKQFNCKYFMVSCKSGEGVTPVFDYLFQQLQKDFRENVRGKDLSVRESFKLTNQRVPVDMHIQKKKQCC